MIQKVCDTLTVVKFSEGDAIIKQGDEADCAFIVYSGIVDIVIDGLIIV